MTALQRLWHLIFPQHNLSKRYEYVDLPGNLWETRVHANKSTSHRHVKNIISSKMRPTAIHPQLDSRLCQLPYEILELIIKELDIPSALSFTLTCQILWRVRTTSDFKAVKDDPQLMIQFLAMMEADCKDYVTCYVCFKLHRRQRGKAGGEYPGRPKEGRRICEFEAGEVIFCEHYALYHKVVLLALRAYKRGPAYGIPLKRLEHKCTLHRQVPIETFMWGYKQKYASQNIAFSITPQITAEIGLQLQLKWQYRIDLTHRSSWDGYKYPTVDSQMTSWECVCHRNHHSSLPLLYVIKSAVSHATTNEGCPDCNQPLQCTYCATTFVVHVTKRRPKGYMGQTNTCTVTVTAEKNLGQGGDPRSQPWRGHIGNHNGNIRFLGPEERGMMLEKMYRNRYSSFASFYESPKEYWEGRAKIKFLQDVNEPFRMCRW